MSACFYFFFPFSLSVLCFSFSYFFFFFPVGFPSFCDPLLFYLHSVWFPFPPSFPFSVLHLDWAGQGGGGSGWGAEPENKRKN